MKAPNSHGARVWVVAFFVTFLFAGLLGRLCLIQGMEQPRFEKMARSQHFVTLRRPDRRGSILDCRGRVLANSAHVPSIFVNPCEVEDKVATARGLADLLSLDYTTVLDKLDTTKDLVCLRQNLSPEDERKLKNSAAARELGKALEFKNAALYAKPQEISDPRAAAAILAPELGVEEDELANDLDGLRRFVWVKRKTTDEEAKRVLAAKLEGVSVTPEYKRTYPQAELACQLVGFVGLDENGLEGLEQSLEERVTSRPGRARFLRDAAGNLITTDRTLPKPSQSGADIELTLDSVIQGYAEAALREAWDLWEPKAAFAVVVDPRTGDVLAAASLPAYNPNDYKTYDPKDLKNRARARYIVDWMEPGSIMKAFVFSAALTEKLVTEQTNIFCENGVWLIGGTRRFHDVHPYGTLDAAHVIIKSSNIGAAKMGKLLGPDLLYRYLCRFGFGRPTGFELPGENPGKLRPPSRWTSFSLPSVCVGQEICVTALQMTMGYGAIANDGVLMRPRVIRRVRRPDDTWAEHPVKAVGRAIPAPIAERVRKVLCGVVEEGTGKVARLAAYTMGGKTGTAQKAVGGSVSHKALMCSFVGMAPVERPRLVVMVTVDEPTKTAGGRHYGGTVAGPVAAQIIKQSLAYLGVPPDKPQALARLGYGDNQERAKQ